MFRAPLVFDAEHSAVVFSNSWLAEKVRQADPLLHKLVAGHVEMLLSRTDHDIVVRATHTLAHMLGSKQCSLAALQGRCHCIREPCTGVSKKVEPPFANCTG